MVLRVSVHGVLPVPWEVWNYAAVIMWAWKSISSNRPSGLMTDFLVSGRCNLQFTRWASTLSIVGSSKGRMARARSTRPRFRMAEIR